MADQIQDGQPVRVARLKVTSTQNNNDTHRDKKREMKEGNKKRKKEERSGREREKMRTGPKESERAREIEREKLTIILGPAREWRVPCQRLLFIWGGQRRERVCAGENRIRACLISCEECVSVRGLSLSLPGQN